MQAGKSGLGGEVGWTSYAGSNVIGSDQGIPLVAAPLKGCVPCTCWSGGYVSPYVVVTDVEEFGASQNRLYFWDSLYTAVSMHYHPYVTNPD